MRAPTWLLLPLLLSACSAPPSEVSVSAQALVAGQTPWAVLLCSFRNRPHTSPVPLSRYQQLFTSAGAGTGINMPDFFREMSGGRVDLSGSQVFAGPFIVDYDADSYIWDFDTPAPDGWVGTLGGDPGPLIASCKSKAAAAGVPVSSFYGVIASFSTPIGGARGTTSSPGIAPGPYVIADYRYVEGGEAAAFGHEMGHAYGLSHSGRDGSTQEYADPWDLMSYGGVYFQTQPDGSYGPGYNAWNRRTLGWLDESRVWKSNGGLQETVTLSSLSRPDRPGLLAAEVGRIEDGHGKYLVELRTREGLDSAMPRSTVLIHRHEGARSYLMAGQKDQNDLQAGDLFEDNGSSPVRVDVVGIDDTNHTATIRVRQDTSQPVLVDVVSVGNALFGLSADGTVWRNRASPDGAWDKSWYHLGGARGLKHIAVGTNADGRLEVFGVDRGTAVWHIAQSAPGGDWNDWAPLWGADPARLAVAANKDGRLELFVLTKAGGLVHAAQTAPSGSFGPFAPIGEASGLLQLSVVPSFDGRLTVYCLDKNPGYWVTYQSGVGSAGWEPWTGIVDATLQHLQATQSRSGLIELWGLSSTGQLLHKPPAFFAPTIWSVVGSATGLRSFTVGRQADGRAEVWALDGNPGVWHVAENTPGGAFGAWSADFSIKLSTVTAAPLTGGRLDVFGVQVAGGGAWRSAQQGSNGDFGIWSPIYVPPMTQLLPVLGRAVPELIGLGQDGQAWRSQQLAGMWQPWMIIPGASVLTELALETYGDGRLDLFAASPLSGFTHVVERTPGGSFGDWAVPQGSATFTHIAVSHERSGELAFFGLTDRGNLEYAIQTSPGGTFDVSRELAGPAGLRQLAVRPGPDGALQLLAIDGNPGLWVYSEHAPGARTFDLARAVASPQLTQIALESDPAGNLAVFALDAQGQLLYQAGDPPGAGFVTISGPKGLVRLVVGHDLSGRFEVATSDADLGVWTTSQVEPRGIFIPWSATYGPSVRGLAFGTHVDGSLSLFRLGPHPTIPVRDEAGPDGPFGANTAIVER